MPRQIRKRKVEDDEEEQAEGETLQQRIDDAKMVIRSRDRKQVRERAIHFSFL